MKFNREETVVCSIEIKDKNGNYKDPDTSIKITITAPDSSLAVNDQAMSKDDTGKYYYDWTSDAQDVLGIYRCKFELVDNSRVTMEKDSFELIA